MGLGGNADGGRGRGGARGLRGEGGTGWLSVGGSHPPPAYTSLRASSRAAGREPVGGNELLGSLASLLLDLTDAVSRDVSGLGCLIQLVVGDLDDGAHDVI